MADKQLKSLKFPGLLDRYVIPNDYNSLDNKPATNPDDLKSAFETIQGKNLLNPNTVQVGFIQSDGTVPTSGTLTNYKTSDFIEVESDSDYFVTALYSAEATTPVSTRYAALQYDSGKNALGSSYQNVTPTAGLKVETGATAKYIRVSYFGECDYAQVEKSSSFTDYVPYSKTYELGVMLGDAPVAQVNDIAYQVTDEYMEQTRVPIIQTKQLFDRNDVKLGYMRYDGYLGLDSNYVHTDYIDVSNHVGDTIYFSALGQAADARFIAAYDSSKTVQSDKGATGNTATYVIPSGVSFVIISYHVSASGGFENYDKFQAEYDAITPYVEYGKFFNLDAELDEIRNQNPLYGKKWAVCGDSFTAGVVNTTIGEGKYANQKNVYPYLIGNRNDMDIVSFFAGGRTIAYPSDGTFTNSLTNPSASFYYRNIPSDADYITLYLGINDEHHATSGGDGEDPTGIIPLGTIDDNNTSTYYGAWNVVLSWLIENRPFAHIGMIVTNGLSIAGYRTAQLDIAKKYGIPYIDLNGDSRTPVMIRSINPDIASAVKTIVNQKQAVDYDGSQTGTVNLHPNDNAHKYESTFIEDFLRSI